MSHNKMYREIEGYEDALYAAYGVQDRLDDLKSSIEYGEDKEKIASRIQDLEYDIEKIKNAIGI